ncbi:DUF7024 domain-containing protein [Variovorax sp. JS1663]|uniref:DUF7024 domain-containing protein n=1 Tax=Variovorax sp. JS1663 TaxID=1851577 RepID=UPI000B6F6791|nr:sugar translocase [Variovorax sp. JS1663]OUM02054.1 hypothetical protein A8M77_13170 [Variovorax sp. JS1663]
MQRLNVRTNRTPILWAVAVALSAIIVGTLTAGGARFNLREPLSYVGDSIFYLMTTQRLGEGTGYLINSRQGFPLGSQLFDFVGSDWGNMLVLDALQKVSGSAAWANNVYFLAGFPLSALAAFWCLRRLEISGPTSSVFALLFAIIPFHFLRIPHLYFTWYFVVPVYVWFAVELYKGTGMFTSRGPSKAVVLAALACFGVYYAAFGCMVLFIGAVLGWLRHRSARPLLAGVFAVIFVCVGVAANLLPNIYLIQQFGKNSELAHRVPAGSEVYGLKITQLILPRPDHRLEQLAAISADYGQQFPNVNENVHSALGFVGVIGLLLVIASAIAYSPRVQEQRRSLLFMLGATTVVLLLTATSGGFSALFSLLVTPLIRGWNRISVVVAFLSLAGLAIAVDGARHRFASTGRAAALGTLGLTAIAIFGIWDQTSRADQSPVKMAQAEYRKESEFYRAVEASLPEGAAVYQLPFMRFPESPMKGRLSSYDLSKGFLHSRSLKWSYGAAVGRVGADFMEHLSTQPSATQLEVARFLGFSGFLIDRRGYHDNGQAIDEEASKFLGGVSPIEDQSKDLAFYSLRALPAPDSLAQMSPAATAWLERWKISKTAGVLATRSPYDLDFQAPAVLNTQARAATGLWGGAEEWGTWTVAKVVKLQLKKPLPLHFTLEIEANAFGPNAGREVGVRIGSQSKAFTGTAAMSKIRIPFDLTESTDLIELTVPAPTSPKDVSQSADTRTLGLGLRSLSVVEQRSK